MANTGLRGKFTVIQAYLRKQEKSQTNSLTLHLKELEKEQTKPKVSRRKEIIKIRRNQRNRDLKKIEKINQSRSCFFEMINKIGKPLARLIKKKRGPKSIISEMKKKLQLTPEKYKGS